MTEGTDPTKAGPSPSFSKPPGEVQCLQADVVVDYRNLLAIARNQKIQEEKVVQNP